MSTRIVIAEDSRIQARMLVKRLETAGYEVRAGADGQQALDLIRQSPPDLIISDIEMPVINGYELCRAVKDDPALKSIPLILLSTLSEPEDIITGLQAGADNYVTKPYETDYLLGRVESLLDTPIDDSVATDDSVLEVRLKGKTYAVQSGRQQVLNLLISTFENAVEKNGELIRANQDLSISRDQLAKQNETLEQLNTELESTNARMTRDLDAAARIQRSLLPASDRGLPLADVAWRYIPCDELAGDFLNFFPLTGNVLAFYVVDVSGHGVASSLLSVAVARSLTRHLTASSILVRVDEDGSTVIRPPTEVAAELNRRFPMEDQGNLYFTMCYGTLNMATGEVEYVSAGHVPPIRMKTDGQCEMLPAEGFAIGWMDDVEYDRESTVLEPGDRFFILSDGVNEAMDQNLEEFGDANLLIAIGETHGKSLDASVAHLKDKVDHWCRIHGPKDDVSIVAIEYKGPGMR